MKWKGIVFTLNDTVRVHAPCKCTNSLNMHWTVTLLNILYGQQHSVIPKHTESLTQRDTEQKRGQCAWEQMWYHEQEGSCHSGLVTLETRWKQLLSHSALWHNRFHDDERLTTKATGKGESQGWIKNLFHRGRCVCVCLCVRVCAVRLLLHVQK